ncbi:arginine--tRNA ligase [Listeria ivanovii]|uniref:Arginine--tRNA ligase n=2 Tax=Listeria ivanovii TaxID=1638 RepID=A0ABS1G6D4_LISIV|nr:arginine--tRNA ligase [Listeria ivanovii]AIS60879.1 arginine--tRNA ligase [Listeria ivanovii subsp. londoniensis]AIS63705.1 arginine--tRNA ligase [Listeria ivanovii subsp. londoniensis]MBC2254963.1 arginine--tRNA ligase [Listeria ivanovii]MBK1962315.1 arginine--tRNA ligase [Listeria ivanovii subsp. londoniensis]MBK1967131.1 arginine--tRNA ligase [Listeria ivanovii subsp. londoniensis]
MNVMQENQVKLTRHIKQAVVKAVGLEETEVPEILLEVPKDKKHGDYSTNIAMQLARVAKKAPRQIAESIVPELTKDNKLIKEVEIAGPGFINFYLDNAYLTDLVPVILAEDNAYGKSDFGRGEKFQIEFVSANPTGDLHLGHARGAAIGDSLANIMTMAGYNVSREYYINDAGNQINNLVLSAEARYFEALGLEAEFPEDGYRGADIISLGKDLAAKYGDKYVHTSEEERRSIFRVDALAFETAKLRADLEEFRVSFDEWFSETSLYEENKVLPALERLRQNGYIYEQDGATWLRTTDFEDDKDRVLIKSDGSYTYFLPDIAYHLNKLERGFDVLIDIWGADHHGYIPRMRAAIEALGYSPNQLEVEIIQLVHLFEDGVQVKMSKRTGKSVTMRDLIEEVGLDATRYFFAMRSSDTHMNFDMSLAKSTSNDNPVYYVQYAHARISSILRSGKEQNLDVSKDADMSLLQTEAEYDLLKVLGEFADVVAEAAVKRAPHRIVRYLNDLASAFHRFYNSNKVLDMDNLEVTKARLALIKTAQITLRNGLTLLGVSAPEKM